MVLNFAFKSLFLLQGGASMTVIKQKEIHLANRPEGMPSQKDFKFVESEVPSPKKQFLLLEADQYQANQNRQLTLSYQERRPLLKDLTVYQKPFSDYLKEQTLVNSW